METVVKSILAALETNGFPEKKVRLPFQAIFKSCKSHDTTVSAVMKALETSEVIHEMDGDRILFYHRTLSPPSKHKATENTQAGNREIPDDIYTEAMDQIKNMDPKEVERIKEQVMKMSPEEQAEMMKKAQQMFKKDKK